MRKPQNDLSSYHHTEYHGFIEGSLVVEIDCPFKVVKRVVSVSGFLKDDRIQLDSKKSAWEIAGNFKPH